MLVASVCLIVYLSTLYLFDIKGYGRHSKIRNQTSSDTYFNVKIECCKNEFGRPVTIMCDDGLHIELIRGETANVRIEKGTHKFTVYQYKSTESENTLEISEDTELFVWSETDPNGHPFKIDYSVEGNTAREVASHNHSQNRKLIISLMTFIAIVVIIGLNFAMMI